MAKFKIGANAEIDLLTKGELDDSLADSAKGEWQERARGVKVMRFTAPVQASLTATAIYVIPYTPAQGYSWALRLVGATFSAAFNLRAWVTSDPSVTSLPTPNNMMPLGVTGGSALAVTLPFSGTQMVLNGGDFVVMSASGSVTLNSYVLTAVEVPTELLWKLV